jgi:hypothetical protein
MPEPAALPPEDRLHLSIDLETLDTVPGAAIATIGLVLFRELDGAVQQRLELAVDLDSCFGHGLTAGGGTLSWWATATSEAARRAAFRETGRLPLPSAIDTVRAVCAGAGDRLAGVWGWGAAFDVALLEAAASRCPGPRRPLFPYRLVRCGVTLKALTGFTPHRDPAVHHTAVEDAAAQARAIFLGLARLRLAQTLVDRSAVAAVAAATEVAA